MTTTAHEIEDAFRAFLADVLDVAPERIEGGTDLLGELELDSLTVLELAVFSEERFGVDLEAAIRDRLEAGGAEGAESATVTLDWLAEHVAAAGDGVSA